MSELERLRGKRRRKLLAQLADRDGFDPDHPICRMCGDEVIPGDNRSTNGMTVDRRVPRLGYTLPNTRVACRSCNASKSDDDTWQGADPQSDSPFAAKVAAPTYRDSDSAPSGKLAGAHTHTRRPQPPNEFTPAIPPGLTYGIADATRRSDYFYPQVWAYFTQRIALDGRIRRKVLEADAAYNAGCSIASVRREYMERLTSTDAPWEIVFDDAGVEWVQARMAGAIFVTADDSVTDDEGAAVGEVEE